jgi:hypothetical protein
MKIWKELMINILATMLFSLSLLMIFIEKLVFSLFFFSLLILSLLYKSNKEMEKYYIFFWIVAILLVTKMTIFNVFLPLPISINLSVTLSFFYSLIVFLSLVALVLSIGYTTFFVMKKEELSFRNLPIAWGFGLGILSFLLILLGLTIGFQFKLILISQLPFLFFVIYRIINKRKKFELSSNFFISLSIILPFLLTTTLHVIFYPELYWDSLAYGINLAKIYLKEGRIPLIAGGPSLGIELSSNYPPAHQVLLAYFFYFCKDSTQIARLFSLTNSIFLIILTYYWSKEIFNKRIYHFLSLIVLVSLPLFILFSRYSIFYIYFALQASLSFYFLYKFFVNKEENSIYLSAVFAGFSFLSSYLGIIPAFAFFFISLFVKKDLNKTVVASFLFILISSLWLLRNLFYLGDPLWPFFGGNFIDEKILENTLTIQKQMQKTLGFSFDDLNTLENSIQRLFFTYPNFFNGIIINGLKPFLTLFALPAMLFAFKRGDKKMIFFSFLLLLNLFFYILIFNWFERYMIAASLPTIFLSVYLISIFERSKLKFLLFSLVFILFYNSIFFSLLWDECHPQNEKNYWQMLEKIGDYNSILEFCYGDSAKAWEWISSSTENDAKIATNDIRDYYINRSVTHTDSWELKDLYHSDNDECMRILCSKRISYLYINPYANTILPPCLTNVSSKDQVVASYKDINIYKLKC